MRGQIEALAQGTDGGFGGATFDYTFDFNVDEEDPGQGRARLNQSLQKNANAMYIDSTDDQGVDISSFLQTIDSVTSTIKGYVRIARKSDSRFFLLFQISDLIDNTGWWTINITN